MNESDSSLVGLMPVIVALLAVVLLMVWLRPKQKKPKEQQNTKLDQVIIKTYTGRQAKATALYKADAAVMASKGYYPTSQSWAPGAYSGGDFVIALLLCFVLIGFPIFLYMLCVKPPGTLSVTYELRAATANTPKDEKTCPSCAEQVKAAAVVCRFCGHKFAQATG
jgi:uncharacterized protein UPF0547